MLVLEWESTRYRKWRPKKRYEEMGEKIIVDLKPYT